MENENKVQREIDLLTKLVDVVIRAGIRGVVLKTQLHEKLDPETSRKMLHGYMEHIINRYYEYRDYLEGREDHV